MLLKSFSRIITITFFLLIMCTISAVLLLSKTGILPFITQRDTTLICAASAGAITLDPALTQDPESNKIIANIFEGLVRFKPGTTEVEPALAESWQVSGDCLEWTFYLRKNVTFHDGTPLNAEAVKFSIDRQLPPQLEENMPYATFVFGMVERVIAVNPYTVRFIMKYPYAPFLHNLAMTEAAPIVSPTAVSVYSDEFCANPIGTGPYKLYRWDKNNSIVLYANESYWGEPPKHEKLLFIVLTNSRLRSMALKMHLVDIIDQLTPADAIFLENSGYTVIKKPGFDLSYLGFFTEKEPFNNVMIRQAVSMSIDREHLINTLFHQEALIANGPLPPGILGYNPDNRLLSYNPTEARRLLRHNGVAEGTKITIITYDDTRIYNPAGGEKVAAAIQSDLISVGFDVEIKTYPWQQYKEVLANREGNIFLYGWISDNGDPDNFLYTLLSHEQIESGFNISNYHNEQVNLMLTKARQTTDQKIREQLYSQATELIIEDAPLVFLNSSISLAATAPGLDITTITRMCQ